MEHTERLLSFDEALSIAIKSIPTCMRGVYDGKSYDKITQFINNFKNTYNDINENKVSIDYIIETSKWFIDCAKK